MPITRNCRISGQEFVITDQEITLLDKLSPVIWGEKFSIPLPTLCPEERRRRRLAFRNERKLYKRKCHATEKEIVSIFSPDKPYIIYSQDYWWSDKWDPIDYGREFDFRYSAFEQYSELIWKVPMQSNYGFQNENCDYTNYLWKSKSCYLTNAWIWGENLLYCYWITTSSSSIDSMLIKNSSELYNCIDCNNCYSCISCLSCDNCSFCYFCDNLYWKNYYWKNQESSKEEIEELLKRWISSLANIWNSKIHDYSENISWKRIFHSKSIFESIQIEDSKDCYYWSFGISMNNANDFDYDSTSEWVYECHTGYKNYHSWFLAYWNELQYSYYCSDCFNLDHCFLCTWLHNKSYCILNKQYTKEEYEELVSRIIEKMMSDGEWWEFFPASLSPFGYNETVAQEYYPLKREEALLRKLNWSNYEAPFPSVSKVLGTEGMKRLPEDISQIPDDILNWALTCEVTGKPFRIIKQELEFYRKHGIPIPRRHPDVRHMDRMKIFQQ
jgi:hypothetical protein